MAGLHSSNRQAPYNQFSDEAVELPAGPPAAQTSVFTARTPLSRIASVHPHRHPGRLDHSRTHRAIRTLPPGRRIPAHLLRIAIRAVLRDCRPPSKAAHRLRPEHRIYPHLLLEPPAAALIERRAGPPFSTGCAAQSFPCRLALAPHQPELPDHPEQLRNIVVGRSRKL